jgi:hypothetical protein
MEIKIKIRDGNRDQGWEWRRRLGIRVARSRIKIDIKDREQNWNRGWASKSKMEIQDKDLDPRSQSLHLISTWFSMPILILDPYLFPGFQSLIYPRLPPYRPATWRAIKTINSKSILHTRLSADLLFLQLRVTVYATRCAPLATIKRSISSCCGRTCSKCYYILNHYIFVYLGTCLVFRFLFIAFSGGDSADKLRILFVLLFLLGFIIWWIDVFCEKNSIDIHILVSKVTTKLQFCNGLHQPLFSVINLYGTYG